MAESGNYGHNTPTSPGSGYNSMRFAIEMAKAAMMTCTIVKVVKVSTKGEVGPIGRVSVLPLVDMVDGVGQTVKHGNVHNLPFVRIQGGAKAVIMDPKADDIGLVVFADRDISAVKSSKKQSPPGSGRRYNMADGMYISSVVAEKPTCYIRFTDDDKIIASPDDGKTLLTIEKDKITAEVSDGLKTVIKPGRIDLGEENAPNRVMTDVGPSSKVWAII